ncbi:unnamed protein product [Urochloa decumbens]|uniref:Uncharacterized protein n=1 Tax=Urochloa decumbens TaxID=240449 RepID=A0ABC9G0F5_9POAL
MEVVTGALPSLLPKLADLLLGEYKLHKEVKGGIIFLQAELESMKVALEKISETPTDKLDKQDKVWAREVRELSYDIEDKIDAFTVRCKCKDNKLAQHGLKKTIDRTLNWLVQSKIIRRKIATDIRDIKSRVKEVSERRRRYFIVFDDIWHISVWETIRCALPGNNGGCKIITATRILKVAEEIGGAYRMKPLGLHSSRMLLYRRVFGKGKNKCPDEELAEVSDRILAKCAGVPIAIITIASLLVSKGVNKLDWYEVCNSIGTGMEDNTDVENMRNVLSLSYYNMPFHLRTCLLYLSVFPEDYKIGKNRLIWMWIAEGVVQCGKQGQSLFEVGESYFNELVNRSMIQPVYDAYGMMIRSCRVHDMVLDLIRSLAAEENFITTLNLNNAGRTCPTQKIRRLSLQNVDKVGNGTHGATVTASMQQLRSVVVFSSATELIPAFSRFEVVRVLHLENCDLSQGYNLKNIGKLVHLRCLGLRSTNIVQLPEEIGSLQFLQMLDISNNAISTLPFTIAQLRQLKCLYINPDLTTPNRIKGLTSLEELSQLHIGDSLGTIEELGHLTELRVLDIVSSSRQELVECLHKLKNIQNLSIQFLGRTGNLDGWVVGPRHLRGLKVIGYEFSKLPVWINCSRVLNLSFLDISLEELQPEDLEIIGRLPALRDLDMWLDQRPRSNKISREFVISAGLFPCLVHGRLVGFYERVVFRQGAMPMLRKLELDISGAVWSEWTRIPDLGFENLPSLLYLHVGLRESVLKKTTDCELASIDAVAAAAHSLVIPLAIFREKLGIEEAIELIRLEEDHQVDRWGLVEGGHDVDIADLKVQMSSAVVFLGLSRGV